MKWGKNGFISKILFNGESGIYEKSGIDGRCAKFIYCFVNNIILLLTKLRINFEIIGNKCEINFAIVFRKILN